MEKSRLGSARKLVAFALLLPPFFGQNFNSFYSFEASTEVKYIYSVSGDMHSDAIFPRLEYETKPALVELKERLESERLKKQKAAQKVIFPKVESGEITKLITRYASQFGADSSLMVKIAQCESGLRAEAVNGPYGGMFQFIVSTWSSNRRAMGLDTNPTLRFNAEEAIKTAAFKMGRDGYGAWPACFRKARLATS